MMMTRTVPNTTPAKATATAPDASEVKVPGPEEDPRNGCGSWSRARYRKRLVIWQSPKHPRQQNRENPKLGKSQNKIAGKGKAANKLVKNSSKTAGRKKREFTEGSATTTSREARSNSKSARKKNMTHKNSTLQLAAEAENNSEIVSGLIPQSDSNNNDESRYHIITNSTVNPVLIC